MDTWLIILITLVVVGSGIYYMSLLSDKWGRRLWKKKMVLTCLLLFLAGAGLFACFSGLLDQKEFRDTVWYLALFMMGAGGLLLLRLVLMRKKTDEEIQPDNVYKMHGNQITVRTLDLNLPFSYIAKQLNTIAETHFDLPERSKV